MALSRRFATGANCGFKFQKRRQLFICTHNESLSVVTMCVTVGFEASRCGSLQSPECFFCRCTLSLSGVLVLCQPLVVNPFRKFYQTEHARVFSARSG
jgi:hypothetical protein